MNSCATIDIGSVDPTLKPYLYSFLKEGAKRQVYPDYIGLTMKFDKIADYSKQEFTVGYCETGDNVWQVVVDTSFWNFADDYEKEELVYHELGHCLLGRDHCNVVDSDGHTISIMNEYIGDSADYQQRHDALVDELFHPDARCPSSN